MNYGDNAEEPIISVPSFNQRYFKVGQGIVVRVAENGKVDTYHGLIKTVDHQEMNVLTVDHQGNTVTVEVMVKDVLSKRVALHVLS